LVRAGWWEWGGTYQPEQINARDRSPSPSLKEDHLPVSVLLSPLTPSNGMFDGRAFRSWGHILAGACVVAGLFLGIMLMAEEVVGNGARLTRAAVTIALAAFFGYVGTAWIIRLDLSVDEGLGDGTGW